MARPKRSTAAASNLRSTKSTSALKNAAAAKTAAPALSFRASKITKWSEKKKGAEGKAVEIQVEEVKVEEVTAVETTEEVVRKEVPQAKSAPVTPRKTKGKRQIEEDDGGSVVKKIKVLDIHTPKKSLESQVQVSSVAVVSSDQTVPSSPAERPVTSLPSEASTAITDDEADETAPAPSLGLPKRTNRLITIHKSTLSLLLIHYATHSKSQPAILSQYLPQISRDAGTNISLADLQRVTTLSQNSLRLVNVEGRGNAIELVNGVSPKVSNLGTEFKAHVEKWWEEKVVAGGNEDEALDGIDLAPILPHGNAGAKPAKPATLSKGQRRLQELKSFTLTKQAASASVKKGNDPTEASKGSVASRNSSLLERLKAKALAAKSAPAPPSTEELQRKTALQSLESIIPILLQLTTPSSGFLTGRSKLVVPSTTSFPMHTIISNIKTSLQKPISNQEVERCLRLLADEVASEFVKIVEWKGDSTGTGLVGVVFDRKGREKVEKWRYTEEKSI
ncbi:hypothetical protein ABW19_dt0203080 [Dactylella cylindrospora]|nr:hypothetical protein ABW19_dt0203080 [Dactylella cylindrospora]